MKKIVGIRFKKLGKIYFFNPCDIEFEKGQSAIVETARGVELGEVAIANRIIDDSKIIAPLKDVIRLATEEDIKRYEENEKKSKEAYAVCEKKIQEHKLDTKLVDVEYTFDGTKLLFYFTADGRIDFRDLVKDLASIYKNRIELRQIGVRDEVKRIGGNGVCGRELCCCSFLRDFETVSIKMAKEQNISLNPSKLSGNCGRLMCCLKYESDVYEEKLKKLPHIGAIVKTEDGVGEVESIETLKEVLKVKIKNNDGDGFFYKKYKVSDIKVIKDVQHEKIDEEELEHKKELEELEKLEKLEKLENQKNKH